MCVFVKERESVSEREREKERENEQKIKNAKHVFGSNEKKMV